MQSNRPQIYYDFRKNSIKSQKLILEINAEEVRKIIFWKFDLLRSKKIRHAGISEEDTSS